VSYAAVEPNVCVGLSLGHIVHIHAKLFVLLRPEPRPNTQSQLPVFIRNHGADSISVAGRYTGWKHIAMHRAGGNTNEPRARPGPSSLGIGFVNVTKQVYVRAALHPAIHVALICEPSTA
jgi:hypothetical protein